MYANDHNGQTPPDLTALVKYEDMSPSVLVDPLHPQEKIGFIYVRPAGDWQKHDQDVAVLYEAWPEGHNIGFADGRVEWAGTRQQVEEQIKATKTRNAAGGEPSKAKVPR